MFRRLGSGRGTWKGSREGRRGGGEKREISLLVLLQEKTDRKGRDVRKVVGRSLISLGG